MTRAIKRTAGQALMWTGFVATAIVSTRQTNAIDWTAYAAAFAVGAAGVVILRATARRSAEEQAAASVGLAALATSLSNIREWLGKQLGSRDSIGVYEIHLRIDEQLTHDLRAFADGREAIIDACGLEVYAAVMSEFATAERTINRAWSASADGYVDEVWRCLERAESLIAEALATLDRARMGSVGERPPQASG